MCSSFHHPYTLVQGVSRVHNHIVDKTSVTTLHGLSGKKFTRYGGKAAYGLRGKLADEHTLGDELFSHGPGSCTQLPYMVHDFVLGWKITSHAVGLDNQLLTDVD